ncbi:hypothetical protein Amico_0372 [Aminobacterium colombiense DSM 12261]|jgi:hypothetical protein|uniref:Uncharacterized protein n=1 Tax=Aminobacterium colombiense (strain DSM 12261 / ALA-1) TaxID=572547 RepID=D5ED83_AMICL|nr:hypothetical protein Amico_0372 [Aminobacterium colombiense DSM 12261]
MRNLKISVSDKAFERLSKMGEGHLVERTIGGG